MNASFLKAERSASSSGSCGNILPGNLFLVFTDWLLCQSYHYHVLVLTILVLFSSLTDQYGTALNGHRGGHRDSNKA